MSAAGGDSGTWLEELRARGPVDVALALGLEHDERHHALSPCPACGADKRHPLRHDRRGAVGLTRDGGGWRCHQCDAGGDAVALAAWHAVGKVPAKGDPAWRDVRRVCAGAALCAADPQDGEPSSAPAPRPPPAPRPSPAPPARPPLAEVLELWGACWRMTDDLEAVRWARSRALNAGDVEDFDLARVIPPGAPVPAWAHFRGRPWSETHRLVVPMVGPGGRVMSLHARALGQGEPKSVSPTGYEVRGLVMASAFARQVLGGADFGCRPTICVAEGVPDFLTLGTEWSDADEDAPGVLGIVSGSWTAELAARIPDGAVVVVATDPDAAGEKYLETIVNTLAERMRAGRVRVKRWRPSLSRDEVTR